MRRTPLIVLVALSLLAALPALAGSGDIPAQELSAEPIEALLDAPAVPAVDAEGACDAAVPEAQPASTCPFGGPVCVEHDDCDEFCGDPAFGYCEIQGFFPTGCCSCLG